MNNEKRSGGIKIAFLVAAFLIAGVFSLTVFALMPEERKGSAVLWISWAFGGPVNFLAAAFLICRAFRKSADGLIRIPLYLGLAGIFTLLYIAMGATFIFWTKVELAIAVVLLAALSAIYLILAMYVVLGAEYIARDLRRTRKKVLFVKLLEADILDAVVKAKHSASASALENLAEQVRFSDPMSDSSLAVLESEILAELAKATAALAADETADITPFVTSIERLLDQRNRRCLILK